MRRVVEVLADEAVDVAVEDSARVAHLEAGAVVLDALGRVERVRADLRAPLDRLLLAALGGEHLGTLSLLLFEELGAQEAHRGLAVLELRALVLALDDDAGRHVRDADRRVGLVHVLAAGSGSAVGVDAQVVLVDLDLDLVGDHRPHVHLGEGGVAARLRVEGRDADQAVDAALGAEEPVGVLALGDEGGGLEPGLLALGRLAHLDLEAAALGPAQVHAKEHLGPVLRVGAAGAGAHRHHRVARVVLAVEEARLLELGEAPLDRGELRVELGCDLGIVRGHLEQVAEVSDVGLERAEAVRRFCARACSADVFAAVSWSSQKPGACIRSSSSAISPSSEAGSKVVREKGQPLACRADALVDRAFLCRLGHGPSIGGAPGYAAGSRRSRP